MSNSSAMNRVFTLVVLGLLTLMAPTKSATASGLFVESARGAVAAWWYPHGEEGILRSVAFQERISADGGLSRFAILATATCGMRKNTPFGCRDYRIERVELDAHQFDIDPMLKSASVNFRLRGNRFSVSWRGVGEFQLSKGQSAGVTPYPDGSVASAHAWAAIARAATARGTGFGISLSRRTLYTGTISLGGNGFGIFCVRALEPLCALP